MDANYEVNQSTSTSELNNYAKNYHTTAQPLTTAKYTSSSANESSARDINPRYKSSASIVLPNVAAKTHSIGDINLDK